MKLIHILAVIFFAALAIAADSIKIQSALIRPTSQSTNVQALRDVITQSGKEVSAVVDDHKLLILPTIVAGDSICIEATFTEHASAAKPAVIKISTLTANNGKKAIVKVGSLGFDFTPTIQRDQQ